MAKKIIEKSRRAGFLAQIRLSRVTTAFFLTPELAAAWLQAYQKLEEKS